MRTHSHNFKRQTKNTKLGKFQGCLLGGAVGDALGAPVEFFKRSQILETFGRNGIRDFAPAFGGLGKITDDTQMTLFTAEGMLRAWVRGQSKGISSFTGVTAGAYMRWLRTQDEQYDAHPDRRAPEPGWLYRQPLLHHRRAPGLTCLSSLTTTGHTADPARNDSKGCGAVMRMAPVGLFCWRRDMGIQAQDAFDIAVDLAALTHGHPTGRLAAGAFAVLILALTAGGSMAEALALTKSTLRPHAKHEETLHALEQAEHLAQMSLAPNEAIAQLGLGWVAEEALAIGVYCALVASTFRKGVLMAVNHDGDSDSTGSIAGNLLGTLHGVNAIPSKWLDALELRDVIREVADDLYAFPNWNIGEYTADADEQRSIWKKYPGV